MYDIDDVLTTVHDLRYVVDWSSSYMWDSVSCTGVDTLGILTLLFDVNLHHKYVAGVSTMHMYVQCPLPQ